MCHESLHEWSLNPADWEKLRHCGFYAVRFRSFPYQSSFELETIFCAFDLDTKTCATTFLQTNKSLWVKKTLCADKTETSIIIKLRSNWAFKLSTPDKLARELATLIRKWDTFHDTTNLNAQPRRTTSYKLHNYYHHFWCSLISERFLN